jgi:hypothetical protein
MAVGTDSSNPTSYELEILTIVNNEGEGFDIRDMMIELNLYESITRNFLMGELLIGDSIGLKDNAKLFGQESLRLRFKQPTGKDDEIDEDDVIDQVFRIYKITNEKRIDETSVVYQLYFTAPEFLTSKRTRISQALRGSMTDIAAKIAEDHLGIANSPKDNTLEPHFELREKSLGDNYHIVVPNWTVNYTINHLCAKAQGIDASSGLTDSFYFFQTANGGYRIQSIANMMDLEYAGGRPFVYSQAASDAETQDTSYDESDEAIGPGRRILDYQINSSANVLEGTVNGLFGSRQITLDNTYQFFIDKTYSFLDKFHSSKTSTDRHPWIRQEPEITHIGTSADQGDVKIIGSSEGKSISEYPDAHLILASDSSFINDDENKIVQPDHKTHMGARQSRQATGQLLDYYTMGLVLSARTDISVGQTINLEIPPAVPGEDVEQTFFGGQYLITELAWNLKATSCQLNVKVIKDSLINQIETAEINYGETV